jgi:hypothetical protein
MLLQIKGNCSVAEMNEDEFQTWLADLWSRGSEHNNQMNWLDTQAKAANVADVTSVIRPVIRHNFTLNIFQDFVFFIVWTRTANFDAITNF